MSSSASNGRRMLHIVNKSSYERTTLDSALRMARPGSALLLIEDGIYAAVKDTAAAAKLQQAATDLALYALRPDVEARGLQDRMLDHVKMIDYGGFVDLVAEHDAVQSWL
jgi:tRNA 2-thiouridine synthesizing protein B